MPMHIYIIKSDHATHLASYIDLAACLYKGLIAIILDPLRVVEIMIISILQNYVIRVHSFLA